MEKSELEISSNQDLPKSDFDGLGSQDQSSDPDNSYVFVSGADGLDYGLVDNRDAVGCLDDGLVDNKSGVDLDMSMQFESKAPAEFVDVELEAVNEEINRSLKYVKNEAERIASNPPVVNGIPMKKEIFLVDGEGIQDTLEEAKLGAENGNLDVMNGEVNELLKKGENGNVERTDQNPCIVNGVNIDVESFLEDTDGIQDAVEEHVVKTECWAEAEIKQVEDLIGKVESSEAVEIAKVNDQNEGTEIAEEAEQKITEDKSTSKSSPGLEENLESDIRNLGLVSASGDGGELNNISPLNESVKTQDVCEGEINLGSYEAPQLVVANTVKHKFQEASEEEKDTKWTRDIVETMKPEVPLTTSLNFDLELQPIENEKETLEEAKSALSVEVTGNQKLDSGPKENVQCGLNKEKNRAINVNCCIGTIYDQVLEGIGNDFSVYYVEDRIHHPVVPDEHPYCNRVFPDIMNSETETDAPVPSSEFSDSGTEVHEPLTEVKDSESVGVIYSLSMDDPKSEIDEKGPLDSDNSERPDENSVTSGSYPTGDMVVCFDKEPTFQGDYASIITEASDLNFEDGHISHSSTHVKLEPEFHKNVDTINVITVSSRTEEQDSSATDEECVANIIVETADIKVVEDQFGGSMGSRAETLLLQTNDEFENPHEDHISKTSSEVVEDVDVDSMTKPFNFLIRVPKFNDENLIEQIRDAKIEVDEKTKLRDAIQAQIQEKRANNQIHGVNYEYAKGEDRSARRLLKLKRMEIESLQSVINKAKNAITIEDMDTRINDMEHMIQHETLPLRAEKQLIREIKQLKQLREQLSSNMGSQNEIQQALEQRDDAEERLKILKKELVNLKDRFSKAQKAAVEAENRYDDENKKVKELQNQFRSADGVRQAAYSKWQSLRVQLSQENRYFFKYKDDEAAANNYAFSRNREALYHLCMDQVENFMELWNKTVEFRSEYVRFNTRSTARRFGTLDGRTLGPDEKPHIIPNYVTDEKNERMPSTPENVDSVKQSPVLELKLQMAVENLTPEVQSMKKVEEQKNQTVAKMGPRKSKLGNSFDTVSGWDVSDDMQEEDCVKTREERELITKAEEIRREEAEAKKKEELRLEQLAKAKEAREKKKRHDEKVQMREESRARKEAELKEKEREKKLRKKERKKVASVNDGSESSESTMEIGKEDVQVNDIPASATSKTPKKTSTVGRQNKTKSIPPPLRNRNRKKWQQWMWVSLACLGIITVFWLGNMGLFTNVNLKRRGPSF